MNRTIKLFSLIIVSLLFYSITGAQENWPHWRGPDFHGISKATNVPITWSTTENIIWKKELPSWSAATPIIWGDRIFVTSPSKAEVKPKVAEPEPPPQQQNQRRRRRRPRRDPGGVEMFLICLSKTDGKILWQQQLDNKNKIHNKQNEVSPSPVTDGKNIWVVTGTGMVMAFDMTGKTIWSKNLQQDYGEFGLNWGYASSPMLYDGSLFVEVLHGMRTDEPSYIVCYDGKTGKVKWRQERPTDALSESPDAYTTPVLLKYDGKTEIIISGGDYVTGHDPESGEELWRAAGLNPRKRRNYRIVGTPVVADGMIYAPTRKNPILALKVGGSGDISTSNLVWKWEGSAAPDVPSPICDGKYFYMVDDRGLVSCLDAKKGNLIWGPEKTTEGIVSASPILVEGKIYILNENSVTSVVAAGPEFKLLATSELDGTYTLASPAISNSQIFIRTSTHLYCIGKKGD